MVAILVILGILVWAAAFYYVSQATLGVAILMSAGLWFLLARMRQAEVHHQEVMKALGARRVEQAAARQTN
jgi:hypothetical protein